MWDRHRCLNPANGETWKTVRTICGNFSQRRAAKQELKIWFELIAIFVLSYFSLNLAVKCHFSLQRTIVIKLKKPISRYEYSDNMYFKLRKTCSTEEAVGWSSSQENEFSNFDNSRGKTWWNDDISINF